MKFINSGKLIYYLVAATIMLNGKAAGQNLEIETLQDRRSGTSARVFDFSKMLDQEKATRDELEKIREQREARLRQLMALPAAIEKAVDPEKYLVGPGDIFSFNIWGPMAMQHPVSINPEGKLLLPSIGEIYAAGKSLGDVQNEVIEKAAEYFKTPVTLSLEALRFFRVHVAGAVLYPGTYTANPTYRISELIEIAGGVSGWANKAAVELRKVSGEIIYFNLAAFETLGDLSEDSYVHGGDLIFVPPIDFSAGIVTVEGDFEKGGNYPVLDNESLFAFLQRIGPFSRSTNITQVSVIRRAGKATKIFKPFSDDTENLILENGDRVIIPSDFVYVKGAVRNPGAYPFVANLTAKDYAGMAGGDFQAGSIKNVKVFNPYTGKTKRGPDMPIEAGSVVDLPKSWGLRFADYAQVISTIISFILAAKAVGVIK